MEKKNPVIYNCIITSLPDYNSNVSGDASTASPVLSHNNNIKKKKNLENRQHLA